MRGDPRQEVLKEIIRDSVIAGDLVRVRIARDRVRRVFFFFAILTTNATGFSKIITIHLSSLKWS
jgi:hypothetical protein